MVGSVSFWTIYASVKSSCDQPHLGYCGAFARLVSPGGGAFANFMLPGPWAFCQLRAFNTHTISYQKITTQRSLLEKEADWLIVKDGKKLERFVKACSPFYACISSLLIKPELDSETRELSTWIYVFMVIQSSFSWYYLKNITSYLQNY